MIHQKDGGQVSKTISHYKILEKIGEGGMGEVYLAEDAILERNVALKFLHPYFSHDEDIIKRFEREAKAAAALNHPNIITIHEISEFEGQIFIAMEYVKGSSLRDHIQAGPLPLPFVLDIVFQLCNGLKKAHEAGITHRDIKPENILIDEDNLVKIVDFGLAKLKGATKITKDSSTPGTVNYMSPEQVMGEDSDHRTDIWSIGVVLYEMLTGQLPFKGEFEQVVLYSIKKEPPKSVKEINPEIPGELERIITKSLEKEPKDRYQKIEQLQIDLNEFGIKSEIINKTYQIKKAKSKKFKIISIASIIFFSLILGFLIFRTLFSNRNSSTKPIPIAVISFENQSSDTTYNYLQKVIPNLLITSLEQSPHFQVTTWQRMHDLLRQMGKKETEVIDENLGFELCRMDGVNMIVLGSVTKIGDMFATDVKVLDVKTKKLLKSASSKGVGINSILRHQIDELSWEISRFAGVAENEIELTQLPLAQVATTSVEAYNYFLRAWEDYNRGYLNDSRLFFEKAIQLDSTFAMAYLGLSWAYRDLGYGKKQQEAFDKAMFYSKNATEKDRLMIESYHFAQRVSDYEKWYDILNQIAKKYPKEKDVHFLLACYYRYKFSYRKAIEKFNRTIELDPSMKQSFKELGISYARLGKFNKALNHIEKYASLSPGDVDPISSKADIYFRMGKFDDAIAHYKEAVEIKPDFYNAYLRLGYLYALKEDYPEAMKYVDKFIAIAPSPGLKGRGYHWKCFYHYWLGNFEASFSDLRILADLAEESGIDYMIKRMDYLKGFLYYDRGEHELSEACFKSWIQYAEGLVLKSILFAKIRWHLYAGLMHLKLGQLDSVNIKLQEIESFLPMIDPVLINDEILYQYKLLQSEVLLAENFPDKVIDICENTSIGRSQYYSFTAYIVPENLPFLRDVLARAYYQKGELDKAIREFERLTTFDPYTTDRRLIHPSFYYSLARLYEEKGLLKKAIVQYKKFLELWKDANEDLPEKIDAKKRLANLMELK